MNLTLKPLSAAGDVVSLGVGTLMMMADSRKKAGPTKRPVSPAESQEMDFGDLLGLTVGTVKLLTDRARLPHIEIPTVGEAAAFFLGTSAMLADPEPMAQAMRRRWKTGVFPDSGQAGRRRAAKSRFSTSLLPGEPTVGRHQASAKPPRD